MTFRHQHGPRWGSIPCASTQPSMITGAMNINTDYGCRSMMDACMFLGNSPGPDITMAVGGKQTTRSVCSSVSLPLQICLSSQDMNHSVSLSLLSLSLSLSLSHTPSRFFLPIMVPNCLGQSEPVISSYCLGQTAKNGHVCSPLPAWS